MQEIIDGQKRVFKATKHAHLTEEGQQLASAIDPPQNERDTNPVPEIEARITEIGDRLAELERNLKQLRRHLIED